MRGNKFKYSLFLVFFLLFTSLVFVNCQSQVSQSSTTETIAGPETGSDPLDDNPVVSSDPSSEHEDGEDIVITDDTEIVDAENPEPESEPAPEPDPEPEPTPQGIPFGFWGLNGYHDSEGLLDVQTRFGATVFQVASENPNWTVNTFLPLIRDSGMKVTLRMTSNPDYSTDFDIDTWKADIDAWADSGVQEFIEDGTLIGHMILDDIYNFSGNFPTAEELDEMARYSKEILPGLMTFVRNKASTMPVPVSGHYEYLDAVDNQYTNFSGYSDGPIEDYAEEQTATATSLGLQSIFGLNIADGGDGSSGQPGWGSGKFAMSADEIMTYGATLLAEPNVLMFLCWEYDGLETWSDGSVGSDYFDQSDLQEALYELGQIAAAYD